MTTVLSNIKRMKVAAKKLKIRPTLSRININEVSAETFASYPADFVAFTQLNNLQLPKISCGNGKALAAMVKHRYKFWIPQDCVDFCKKFNIQSRDPIQLFNKKDQDGFKMGAGRGKYYILYPYKVSNKKAMRVNFKFDGSEEEKNKAIEKIKANILEDYLEPPNEQWQLGHKNPETTDNTSANLVLQPPIQAKYRDRYVFIDTLTKIPTPSTLLKMIGDGKSPFTKSQLRELRDGLTQLDLD